MNGDGRDLIGDGSGTAVRRFRARLLGGLGLRPVRAARALVLGCGDGSEAAFLAGLGYRVEAYDLAAHPAWAGLRAAHKGRIRFHTADVAELPRLKGSFDLVLQKDMLHHVDDPVAVLAQMKRLTRPGGRLIALECNRLNPVSYVHLTLMKGHQHFTPGRFRSLLRQAGLERAVLSLREARVWPVDWPAFQDVVDRVQEWFQKLPLLGRLSVYQIAAWHSQAATASGPSRVRRKGISAKK